MVSQYVVWFVVFVLRFWCNSIDVTDHGEIVLVMQVAEYILCEIVFSQMFWKVGVQWRINWTCLKNCEWNFKYYFKLLLVKGQCTKFWGMFELSKYWKLYFYWKNQRGRLKRWIKQVIHMIYVNYYILRALSSTFDIFLLFKHSITFLINHI